jgi:small-conductance mechanosensitive channel
MRERVSVMKEQLIEAFVGLRHSIVSAIPRLGVGSLLIIVGLILAKLTEIASRAMLIRLRFDSLIQKVGARNVMKQLGLGHQFSIFIPKLLFFLVISLFAKTASDTFGLVALSTAIGVSFAYLPNILGAILLIVLGTSFGQFSGRVVTQTAKDSGIASAPLWGNVVSAFVIFVIAMMAIGQLRINTEMVRIVTGFVLGAIALAFGIAFGLGTWNIVRNIAMGFYARKFLEIGKSLEIGGQRGILTAITATHTVLKSEGQDIIVANSTFLEQTVKQ